MTDKIRELSIVKTENGHLTVFDDVMGRTMNETGKSFDFDKFENALNLSGVNRDKTTLVDVGANIGSICVEALSAGYFGRAIAIEPEPKNLTLLKANIAINELEDRIDLHQCAVGEDDDGTITMELAGNNTGDHRIQVTKDNGRFNEAHRKTIEIPIRKLDSVTAGHSDLFLCIDTQGFEGQVLSGGTDTLKNTSAIMMEFWPYGLARSGGYNKVKQALLDSHFEEFMIADESGENEEWRELNEAELDAVYEQMDNRNKFTDLLIR